MAVNLPNRNIPISSWQAGGDGKLRGNDPQGLLQGGSFVPLKWINFDGLSNGAGVTSADTAGKRFDFWGTYGNGYGSIATTAEARPGHSSSCAISVRNGSTGFPTDVDTPAGDGHFGGIMSLPSGLGEGTELWFGAWIKPAAGMTFTTSAGALKFFRASVSDSAGRIETLIKGNNVGWWFHTGTWGLLLEQYTARNTDRNLILDAWNWVEFYVKLSYTPANCIRRLWVNNQLAFERTLGTENKWYENGQWNTDSFASATGPESSPERLLYSPTSQVTELLFPCTYWNGGAPGDQVWYVQNIVAHNVPGDLVGSDEFGNKMIGSSATFLDAA